MVFNKLPAQEVSHDGQDIAGDGIAVSEAQVPAGSLDAALPLDLNCVLQRSCFKKRNWEETFGEVAKIDVDSDMELLTWAKKVRTGHTTR